MNTSLDRVNQVRQVSARIRERRFVGALAHAARRFALYPRSPRVRQSDCDGARSHCLSRYRPRPRAGLEPRPAGRCTGLRSAAAAWSLPSIGVPLMKSTPSPGTSRMVLSHQPMDHTSYRKPIDISFMRGFLEAISGNDIAFMTRCRLIRFINGFPARRAGPGRHPAKGGMPTPPDPQIRSGTVR